MKKLTFNRRLNRCLVDPPSFNAPCIVFIKDVKFLRLSHTFLKWLYMWNTRGCLMSRYLETRKLPIQTLSHAITHSTSKYNSHYAHHTTCFMSKMFFLSLHTNGLLHVEHLETTTKKGCFHVHLLQFKIVVCCLIFKLKGWVRI